MELERKTPARAPLIQPNGRCAAAVRSRGRPPPETDVSSTGGAQLETAAYASVDGNQRREDREDAACAA